MKTFIKNFPWGKLIGLGLQVIGGVLTGSDGSNMSNHGGNNYRGNNYRGNNYRGNNYRGNNFKSNRHR